MFIQTFNAELAGLKPLIASLRDLSKVGLINFLISMAVFKPTTPSTLSPRFS